MDGGDFQVFLCHNIRSRLVFFCWKSILGRNFRKWTLFDKSIRNNEYLRRLSNFAKYMPLPNYLTDFWSYLGCSNSQTCNCTIKSTVFLISTSAQNKQLVCLPFSSPHFVPVHICSPFSSSTFRYHSVSSYGRLPGPQNR